ncbi:NAD(P)/FAD-dependent oxidoreductase [Tropicimonas sp.]|uniref:NAD(P)/FAD-dependent oxidoreductase n=1 Tax=Tropicimonas sp. TaxID=2067044 RepID=UPI003A851870
MALERLYEKHAYGPAPIERSYWRSTVPDRAGDWPVLEGRQSCDFAIVGGGYTGLTAALDLAEAGADVVLVEAEWPGWGASGRNGGFCCLGGSPLSAEQLSRRFGSDEARQFCEVERLAVDLVAATLGRLGIDADTHSRGETLLAPSALALTDLERAARLARLVHGVECEFIGRDTMASTGMTSPAFHAALTIPVGFALNPLKYALGLAGAAGRAGARIFGGSPALTTVRRDGNWHLGTPRGEVVARRLLVATNGYSSENLPPWLAGRYLPVQSNILVTREMSVAELEAQGWTSHQMCYDTLNLLHYFRLMPNRRMLFGLRGAVRATPRADARVRRRARADFDRMFPAWRDVETPFFWSGFVAMARDMTPYVGPMDGVEDAFAALCYHGNGVAMGSYAGGLMADLALGRAPRRPYPAPLRAPLRRFPAARFRRAILPAAYGWYALRDRI